MKLLDVVYARVESLLSCMPEAPNLAVLLSNVVNPGLLATQLASEAF